MKYREFRCPALYCPPIICYRIIRLSVPYISLIVCPINRTIIPCIFWHFHFLHEILHRLYIHLCLLWCAYLVLWCNLISYVRNLYSLFRLHVPESRHHFQCGEMYFRNYYRKVTEKGRTHYDLYFLQSTEEIPDDYEELSLACLRQDGFFEASTTLSNICRLIQNCIEGLENFHFHQLRHTYTSSQIL